MPERKLPWKRILVFGAHADDEIIGPGGTLARAVREGAKVTVVTFTTGQTGYAHLEDKDRIVTAREQEAQKAQEILGYQERIGLGIPTQEVHFTREIYQECTRLIRHIRPEVIFTHSPYDEHPDHVAISDITQRAWQKAEEKVLPDLGETWHCPELYFYEIAQPFTQPTLIVDISETLPLKLAAMKSQETQLKIFPRMLQQIEGLARYRGAKIGTEAGEAFLRAHLLPQAL